MAEDPQSPAYRFMVGVARGARKGAYKSVKDLSSFLYDCVTRPIQTSNEIYESMSTLAKLAGEQEWDELADCLLPEVRKLAKEWDSLSLEKKVRELQCLW